MAEEKPKKPRGRRGKPPQDPSNFHLEPGDNSRILGKLMEIYKWPPIDKNNSEQVRQRIIEYFDWNMRNDMKPDVEGLCMALGIGRSTMYDWETGYTHSSDKHSELIKKAKQLLSAYHVQLGINGKVNPVTNIFVLRNWFGYTNQDQVNVTVETKPLGEAQKSEAIEAAIDKELLEGVPFTVKPDFDEKPI